MSPLAPELFSRGGERWHRERSILELSKEVDGRHGLLSLLHQPREQRHAVEHDLSLTMIATYQWRVKMTAGVRNKSRLCASFDGKHKVSRLNSMLPLVACFILAQGQNEPHSKKYT